MASISFGDIRSGHVARVRPIFLQTFLEQTTRTYHVRYHNKSTQMKNGVPRLFGKIFCLGRNLLMQVVTSSFLQISRAVLRVREAPFCGKKFLDPKLRASMLCSSGFVKWHSPTRIRIFCFKKESAVSPESCSSLPLPPAQSLFAG